MKRIALEDPRYYFNRHLQWLEFNRGVLEETRDIENPLLERVKFLAITANHLDEFVEVRVSSFISSYAAKLYRGYEILHDYLLNEGKRCGI